MSAALDALALALAAPLLFGVAAAPSDEPPAAVAVYQVDMADTSIGPDGTAETVTASGEVRIACVGTDCRITEEPRLMLLRELPLAGGESITGTSATPAAPTACPEGMGDRGLSITADAEGFTAHLTQSPLGWSDCENGSQAYSHAREASWAGVLVSAPACMFTAAGCTVIPSRSGAAEPSVLSSLATPQEAGTAPQQLATAAALALILTLLMSFPTSLVNRVVDRFSGRLSSWWQGRRGASRPEGRRWTTRWWWAGIGVASAAIISGFVDPDYGTKLTSFRVLASIALAFLVKVIIGWLIVIWLTRRAVPTATHEYSFKPLSLLLVVAAVILTRLTGFEPGIIFGLVAGLSFGAMVGLAQKARAALVATGWAFVLALAAWLAYGAWSHLSGESVAATMFVETLSGLVIGGIVGIPLGLLPLRGLGGHTLFAWNRTVWTVCYAIGVFAFFVILMPMPFAWREVGWDLGAWVAGYLLYAAIAVALWLAVFRPWKKPDAAAEAAEEVSADTE